MPVASPPVAWAPVILGRDARRRRTFSAPAGLAPGALDAAVRWLVRTHDATGRRGSSKGYSLLRGWLPAYPETTGYVLETLLDLAGRLPAGAARENLVARAKSMGDWEVEMQEPDGGVMEGHVETRPRRSIVFNTGMVLHGWVHLGEGGHGGYEEAARRAARFLVDRMAADGTWDPRNEYAGLPHTYNSRVAWGLVRWGLRTGDEEVLAAARRQLDWTVAQQQPNGWWRNCVFRAGTTPSTHALAYTMRGLLESHALLGEERWLHSALAAARPLVAAFAAHRWMPAQFFPDWRPAASHACLTGTAQLGGVWLRLHALTGEEDLRVAGLRAVEQAAAFQERGRLPAINGALAGSFPVWGRYAPLQYPNWAARFLAESLMLHLDASPAA